MARVNLSRKLEELKINQDVMDAISMHDVATMRSLWWAGDKPLLTLPEHQTKSRKATKHGYHQAILHLHADRMDFEGTSVVTCTFATHGPHGCADPCIMYTGRGQRANDGKETAVALGRRRRTEWLTKEPYTFLKQLHWEIRAHKLRAIRLKLEPLVRLNGTSDLRWEEIDPSLFDPKVTFADYTKWPLERRMERRPNYHLAYSLQANRNSMTEVRCLPAVGRNVSMIVDRKEELLQRHPDLCVDADLTDTWMINARGRIGLLTPKKPMAMDHPTVYRHEDVLRGLEGSL